MGKVIASITTSVDGYVTGPDDGPAAGLGIGGERLHYWVMGGPWTYAGEHDTDGATGADKEFLAGLVHQIGAGVCGRGMYAAAGAWGGTNPFGGRLFVVTHRTQDAPAASYMPRPQTPAPSCAIMPSMNSLSAPFAPLVSCSPSYVHGPPITQ